MFQISSEMETVSSVPKIGTFAKCFNVAVMIAPVAAAIWLICNVSYRPGDAGYGITVTVIGLIFSPMALLPSMLRVTSTRFYDDGIEQIVLFSKGHFLSKVRLEWASIETVLHKNLAYTMFGKGLKVRVYLGCFYDLKATAKFIHENLPANAVRK